MRSEQKRVRARKLCNARAPDRKSRDTSASDCACAYQINFFKELRCFLHENNVILASQILNINDDIDFMFAVCVKDLHIGVRYCLDLCTLGDVMAGY